MASSPEHFTVWIIEDNTVFREAVEFSLESETGLLCAGSFPSAEAAFEQLESNIAPDVILLDLDLPGMHGLDALSVIKSRAPDTRVLILTEFDDRPKVFQAIGEGAAGYLLKSSPVADISRSIHEVMAGGAALNPQIAKMMLSTFAGVTPQREEAKLTSRETEVLALLAEGFVKKQIGDQLGISYHTVDLHVRGIYKKLQVHNLSGAVAIAIRRGLI